MWRLALLILAPLGVIALTGVVLAQAPVRVWRWPGRRRPARTSKSGCFPCWKSSTITARAR